MEPDIENAFLQMVPSYLADELSDGDRDALEEELQRNDELRVEVEAAREVMRRLKSLPAEEVSQDLAPIVMDKVRGEATRRSIRLRFAVAAALAATVLLTTGLQYFSPPPARQDPARTPAVTDIVETPSARLNACQWLAKNQQRDGSWNITAHGGKKQHAAGIAGLALMAFLDQGRAFESEAVRTADFLLSQQGDNGCIGPDGTTAMYNHGIATVALLRMEQRTTDRDRASAVEKAVKFILRGQSKNGGWGYTGKAEEKPNAAVTAWQIQALHQASKTGVTGAEPALRRAFDFMRRLVQPDNSLAYGMEAGPGTKSPTLSAMGASCLLLAADPDLRSAGQKMFARLMQAPTRPLPSENRADPYLAYFLSRAARVAEDQSMAEWLRVPFEAMSHKQVAVGNELGSFPRETTPWGNVGGTVYTTAMMAACMDRAL